MGARRALKQHKLKIYSENFDEEVEIDLDDQNLAARGHWSDYPIGVAVILERAGYRLRGASLRIRGDVPIGRDSALRRDQLRQLVRLPPIPG